LRKLFETVVARCIKEKVVGGEAFAVDASMIVADAHRRRGVAEVEDLDLTSGRGVAEYLSVLDDTAFGGATLVKPEAISPTDPAARYTAAANSAAVHAYSDNSLVDFKHAVILARPVGFAQERSFPNGQANIRLIRTLSGHRVARMEVVSRGRIVQLRRDLPPAAAGWPSGFR
jgi:hypothetical protein